MALRAPRILGIVGSARTGSVNAQLLQVALDKLSSHGAEVDSLTPEEQESFPLFSETVESKGFPAQVIAAKEKMANADAIIVSSPEYNGSLTPLIVNTITWLSRSATPDEGMYASFVGKHGLVLAASPGGLGGLRSLFHMQDLLINLGVSVLPDKLAIGGAFSAFEGNQLKNEQQNYMLDTAVSNLFKDVRDKANRDAVCQIIATTGQYGQL